MIFKNRMAARAMNDRRAIIDIGSNTVRMVIYDGPLRAPRVIFNEKATARLGRGVVEAGLLSKKAMGVALATLDRFTTLLQLHSVRCVETVATAAVRDAKNGMEFLEAVSGLGLSPRLLSGEEEAMTSAMGVIGAFPAARGVVADLGGGSLELVHCDGEQREHGISLPLGSLSLPQLREGGAARFSRRIHKVIEASQWRCKTGESLYLVGGSFRAFARFAMLDMSWPLDDPHGLVLTSEEALSVCRKVLRGKLPTVMSGLSSARLASLPDTAALLSVMTREIQPERLVFSSWGLREGLLFASLDKATRAQDPLLAGVSAFAETQGVPAAHAAMVAGWTAAANPAEGEQLESLRLAAIMLALAAGTLEPNLRSDHLMGWALRKRWIGIDAEGRALLAACGLANAGRTTPLFGLERLAAPASLGEAQTWGLAVRLCRRFSGVSAQALADSSLYVDGPQLVLAVREPFGALYTDAVAKDLRALATRLGLQPSFRSVAKHLHLR